MRLSVRNNESKETAQNEMRFRIVSRVKAKAPVVTPSAHPLIALFSAFGCAQGSQFRAAFQAKAEATESRTSTQHCRGSISNNIWIAGMRAETEYQLRAEWVSGSSVKPGSWEAGLRLFRSLFRGWVGHLHQRRCTSTAPSYSVAAQGLLRSILKAGRSGIRQLWPAYSASCLAAIFL